MIKFKKSRPLIMGILNVTPDSFSDGGRFNTLEKALEKAKEMEKQGADIIDIGGESTGPNSKEVSLEEERKRVIPVLKKLRPKTKLPISIDTYKSEIAKECLDLGANIINDVTALRGDKKMASTLAKFSCPIILMYSKDNTPRTTIKPKKYTDVIKTIKQFLTKQIEFAEKSGIAKDRIIIDPGMGQFISSIPIYSYEIIARLRELKSLNCPILLGTSRKSFLLGDMNSRIHKANALNTIAYLNGTSIIRTHDVTETYEQINTKR